MINSFTTVVAGITSRSRFLDSYAFIRKKITKSHVIIIMYHRVNNKRDGWSLEALDTQEFERQIIYFCRNFEIMSLDEIGERISRNESLPEKAVAITFDDGYKDNYLNAFPILKKHHIPATVFLISGHIGSDELFWWDKVSYIIHHTKINQVNLDELGSYRYRSQKDRDRAILQIHEQLKTLPDERKNTLVGKLPDIYNIAMPDGLGKELILSWEEVREMSNDIISVGAHSVNHPIMTNISLEQAKAEITQSKKVIEERIAKKVHAFSYPNGNFNPELVKIVRESGFKVAVSAPPFISERPISSNDSPYELSRIWSNKDLHNLRLACSGLLRDLKPLFTQVR